jgi:hypothetical protein
MTLVARQGNDLTGHLGFMNAWGPVSGQGDTKSPGVSDGSSRATGGQIRKTSMKSQMAAVPPVSSL